MSKSMIRLICEDNLKNLRSFLILNNRFYENLYSND